MELRLLTRFEEIQAVAPAWNDLLAAQPIAEPMASADWARTWWRFYGEAGLQLRVGAFLENGRVVGLAPLVRRRHRYRPGLSFRRLEFLGGDTTEPDGVCSEYLCLPHLPERREAVAAAFVRFLKRGDFGPWDELVLAGMNGEDPMPAVLARHVEEGDLAVSLETTGHAPYLPLPAAWDDFLRELPQGRRYDFRKNQRRFDEWAAGTAAFHEARTPEELRLGRELLHRLHEQRWSEAGQAGAFASERFTGFHDAWMAHLLERQQLELLWLTVRDEPVAVLYDFVIGPKVYFYQSGRSLQVPNNILPGVVLLSHAVRRAMARGQKEFDFLAGPSAYKLQFTRQLRPLTTLRAARTTPTEFLKSALQRTRGWWRSAWNQVVQAPGKGRTPRPSTPGPQASLHMMSAVNS